jgi:hypothetical protein
MNPAMPVNAAAWLRPIAMTVFPNFALIEPGPAKAGDYQRSG